MHKAPNAVTKDKDPTLRADHHLTSHGEDHHTRRDTADGSPACNPTNLDISTIATTLVGNNGTQECRTAGDNSLTSSSMQHPRVLSDSEQLTAGLGDSTGVTGGKGPRITSAKVKAGNAYMQAEAELGLRVQAAREKWRSSGASCDVVLTINTNSLKHLRQELRDRDGPLINHIRAIGATRLYFIESHSSHATNCTKEYQEAMLKAELESCFGWQGCWDVVLATHGNRATNTAAVKYAGVCACIFVPTGTVAPSVYTGCLSDGTPSHIEGKQHPDGRWALVMSDNNPVNLFDHLLLYANNSGIHDDRAAYKLATLHQVHQIIEWHRHNHPSRILVVRGDPNAIRLSTDPTTDTVLQVGGKHEEDLPLFVNRHRNRIACLRERESMELETLLLHSYSDNHGVDMLRHFDKHAAGIPSSTTFNLGVFHHIPNANLCLGARIDHVIAHGPKRLKEEQDGLGPFGFAVAAHSQFPADALSESRYCTDHAPTVTAEVTTQHMLQISQDIAAKVQGLPCTRTQGYEPLPTQQRSAAMQLVLEHLICSGIRQLAPHLYCMVIQGK